LSMIPSLVGCGLDMVASMADQLQVMVVIGPAGVLGHYQHHDSLGTVLDDVSDKFGVSIHAFQRMSCSAKPLLDGLSLRRLRKHVLHDQTNWNYKNRMQEAANHLDVQAGEQCADRKLAYNSIWTDMVDLVLVRIRKFADNCTGWQGLMISHACGGGTCSGYGCLMMERLPDVTIMMDNEALYDICRRNLDTKRPTYAILNRTLAQIISSHTASLGVDGALKVDITEFVLGALPTHSLHAPQLCAHHVSREGIP